MEKIYEKCVCENGHRFLCGFEYPTWADTEDGIVEPLVEHEECPKCGADFKVL